MRVMAYKKKNAQPITDEERLIDFERQFKRRNKNQYSTNQGVTGEVFKTGRVMWTNHMMQMPTFMPSIDNLTQKVKETRNVLIGPVYSHLKDWETNESLRSPIAIFQFINKRDFGMITEFDVVSRTMVNLFRKNSGRSLTYSGRQYTT